MMDTTGKTFQPLFDAPGGALCGKTRNHGWFVVGPAGAGKHPIAASLMLAQIAAGIPTIVFETCSEYRLLCEMLGGTYVNLAATQEDTMTIHMGNAPLVVFNLLEGEFIEQLPSLEQVFSGRAIDPFKDNTAAPFLLVDEIAATLSKCPSLARIVTGMISLGSPYCLVAQYEDDLGPFKALAGRPRMIKVSRL